MSKYLFLLMYAVPNVTVENATETSFASTSNIMDKYTYDEVRTSEVHSCWYVDVNSPQWFCPCNVQVVIEIDVSGSNHGMFQLHLENGAGKEWFTGINVHVLGTGYSPTVYDTRDARDDSASIQEAIDDWERMRLLQTDAPSTLNGAIILVYPKDIDVNNPTGDHIENVIMTYPGAKIQGIGKFTRFE